MRGFGLPAWNRCGSTRRPITTRHRHSAPYRGEKPIRGQKNAAEKDTEKLGMLTRCKKTPRRAHLTRIQSHSDRDQKCDVKALLVCDVKPLNIKVKGLMFRVHCKSIMNIVVLKFLRFNSVSSACFWKHASFPYNMLLFQKHIAYHIATVCLKMYVNWSQKKKKPYQGSVSTVSSKCKPPTENGRKKKKKACPSNAEAFHK